MVDCNEDGHNYDEENERPFNTREITIFLIDCTDKMFEQDASFFHCCLQLCKFSFLSSIRKSSKDLFSIIFFGTESKDDGDQNPSYVTTFYPAKYPNAEIIQQLHDMSVEFDYNSFKTKYGHSNNYSIADALWHCSSVVTHCKYKVSSSTIVLMTCHDNPHDNSPMKIIQTKKKALDLESLNIKLHLLYLGDGFDVNLFYKDILQGINGKNYYCEQLQLIDNVDELPDCLVRKHFKRRAVGRMKFHIGDIFMGIEIFNFYRRRTLPTATKLDRMVNEDVSIVQRYFDAETGEQLLKSDMNKYCVIARQQITYTTSDMLKLSTLSEPGLTLLGFKSMRCLSVELHFRPSSWVFPSEDVVCGSKLLFCELLEQCISKNKFALCCFTSRYKGRPRHVCLVPQEEIIDSDGKQKLPAGFHMIYLPYAENIRDPPLDVLSDVTTEQQGVFDNIVKKLSCSSYSPSSIANPKLMAHWLSIETLALNYCDPPIFNDDTSLNYSDISKRLGNLENEFENLFINEDNSVKLNKRKSSSSGERVPKIKKSEGNVPIEQLTVAKLKSYLKENGIKVTGNHRKEDLINMVREHLE